MCVCVCRLGVQWLDMYERKSNFLTDALPSNIPFVGGQSPSNVFEVHMHARTHARAYTRAHLRTHTVPSP